MLNVSDELANRWNTLLSGGDDDGDDSDPSEPVGPTEPSGPGENGPDSGGIGWGG